MARERSKLVIIIAHPSIVPHQQSLVHIHIVSRVKIHIYQTDEPAIRTIAIHIIDVRIDPLVIDQRALQVLMAPYFSKNEENNNREYGENAAY